jgi:hypothetical protein
VVGLKPSALSLTALCHIENHTSACRSLPMSYCQKWPVILSEDEG